MFCWEIHRFKALFRCLIQSKIWSLGKNTFEEGLDRVTLQLFSVAKLQSTDMIRESVFFQLPQFEACFSSIFLFFFKFHWAWLYNPTLSPLCYFCFNSSCFLKRGKYFKKCYILCDLGLCLDYVIIQSV